MELLRIKLGLVRLEKVGKVADPIRHETRLPKCQAWPPNDIETKNAVLLENTISIQLNSGGISVTDLV
jgi:hypothetical protein